MRRFALPVGLGALVALALGTVEPMAASAAAHPPLATDLFPVDNWIGDGLKSAKDVVFGGISLGADAIAQLLTTVFATLVDLLIPKSFVKAGIGAIKWICTVPSFSGDAGSGGQQLQLPHVEELRQTLTWVGVCVLPLGLVYAGGRSIMTPSAYADSPQEVLGRVVFAAAWLAFYLWGWEAITHFSGLVSGGLLSLSWVADGVDNLMTGLTLAGGGAGPISEFAVLFMAFFCAIALLALLVMKIALLVLTAFLFVIGGLIGALYPLPFGRKLLGSYCVAVTAVVALPALWALLFTLAAALMVDVRDAGGGGGDFGTFVTQFWVLGASLATFALAVKLGFSAFGLASSTITSFTAGALLSSAAGGGGGSPSATQTAHKAHSLYNVGSAGASRSGLAGGSSRGSGAGTAAGSAEGVQRTREPAEGLRGAVGSSGGTAVAAAAAAGTGGASAGAQAAAGVGRGAAAGGAAGGAAQAAPKAAASDRAAAAGGQAHPNGPTTPPHSVRSTSSADGEPGPAPQAPAPSETARQTPSQRRAAAKQPPTKQRSPRRPRRSDGGTD